MVSILSTLPRADNLNNMSATEFYLRRDELRQGYHAALTTPGPIQFFAHKGFHEIQKDNSKSILPIDIWSKDGIHPNTLEGRERYKKSIRTALCYAFTNLKKFKHQK